MITNVEIIGEIIEIKDPESFNNMNQLQQVAWIM